MLKLESDSCFTVNAHLENVVEVLVHHFIYSAEKSMEIDHHLYEFGSVEYHIQSQASNPLVAYLSLSIPPLCHGILPNKLSPYTIEKIKGICPNLVEIEEPAREGFQLTLKLNLDQIPRNK
ncbi:actin-related protein 2/3 complex protein, partial [Trifolium medium]|nr:actin-related protein 2/3 complex protein [Trifolium medium]